MWRIAVAAAILLLAFGVLLVPFHPEAVVLRAVDAVVPRTLLGRRFAWLLVETGGNLLMFAGVGGAALLLLHRRVVAFASAAGLSAAAELIQLVIPHRVASVTDFVTNAVGAGLGVLITSWVVARLHRARARRSA